MEFLHVVINDILMNNEITLNKILHFTLSPKNNNYGSIIQPIHLNNY